MDISEDSLREQFKDYTYRQLQQEAKNLKVNARGKKEDLLERIIDKLLGHDSTGADDSANFNSTLQSSTAGDDSVPVDSTAADDSAPLNATHVMEVDEEEETTPEKKEEKVEDDVGASAGNIVRESSPAKERIPEITLPSSSMKSPNAIGEDVNVANLLPVTPTAVLDHSSTGAGDIANFNGTLQSSTADDDSAPLDSTAADDSAPLDATYVMEVDEEEETTPEKKEEKVEDDVVAYAGNIVREFSPSKERTPEITLPSSSMKSPNAIGEDVNVANLLPVTPTAVLDHSSTGAGDSANFNGTLQSSTADDDSAPLDSTAADDSAPLDSTAADDSAPLDATYVMEVDEEEETTPEKKEEKVEDDVASAGNIVRESSPAKERIPEITLPSSSMKSPNAIGEGVNDDNDVNFLPLTVAAAHEQLTPENIEEESQENFSPKKAALPLSPMKSPGAVRKHFTFIHQHATEQLPDIEMDQKRKEERKELLTKSWTPRLAELAKPKKPPQTSATPLKKVLESPLKRRRTPSVDNNGRTPNVENGTPNTKRIRQGFNNPTLISRHERLAQPKTPPRTPSRKRSATFDNSKPNKNPNGPLQYLTYPTLTPRLESLAQPKTPPRTPSRSRRSVSVGRINFKPRLGALQPYVDTTGWSNEKFEEHRKALSTQKRQ